MDMSVTPEERVTTLKIGPATGLVLSLVAGGIAWALIGNFDSTFKVPKEFEVPNIGSPEAMFVAHNAAKRIVDRKNAALCMGMFAALTAVMLGLGEAVARRSIKPVVIAPPLGAAVGAAAGLAGSIAHEYTVAAVGRADIVHTVGEQALMLGLYGFAIGLAMGVLTGSLRAMAAVSLGGAMAGALAGALYPVAISILMPAVNTESLLPITQLSRLLWIGLAAGLVGLLIPMSGRPRLKSNAEAPA